MGPLVFGSGGIGVDERIDDSPETFLGLPLGLQVVGQRYEDEKVLAALEMIEEIVRS